MEYTLLKRIFGAFAYHVVRDVNLLQKQICSCNLIAVQVPRSMAYFQQHLLSSCFVGGSEPNELKQASSEIWT
jgi:hypothetical protein